MKKLFILLLVAITINVNAQDAEKTITLIVSGQGKTQDEAKQNAFRSAIEQAFGAFISSKTEILNDDLVKDEIVSISNGNIQKYEVISEVQISNGDYAISLKATVSVTKLTSFVVSKGFEVEFQGTLFGVNLRLQKLNEESELISILHLCETSNEILLNSLDYTIEIADPIKAQSTRSFSPQENEYQVLLTIKMTTNSNFDKFANYFEKTIKSISMPQIEVDNYLSLKKNIYKLTINQGTVLYLRNVKSAVALQNLFLKSNQYLHNFTVISNIDTSSVKICCYNFQDNRGTQNFYYDYDLPEFWHLNSGQKSFNSAGSLNENPGFPDFIFNSFGKQTSSWSVYAAYLKSLELNSVLFGPENYYSSDFNFYSQKGLLKVNSFDQYYSYPNSWYLLNHDNSSIGNISLMRNIYYCKFLAIYKEEELASITNFKVIKN